MMVEMIFSFSFNFKMMDKTLIMLERQKKKKLWKSVPLRLNLVERFEEWLF